RALRMGIPAAVGGITGAVSGEGAVSGTVQGGMAGIGQELPSLVAQGPKKALNYLRRAEIVKQQYDDIKPGEYLDKILQLPSFTKKLASKKSNWVDALRDS